MGKRSRSKDKDERVEPEAETVEEAVDEASEPEVDGDEAADDGDGRRARVMRFAKRLMDRRELSKDTQEILGSVIATSDKAKTEAVRMVAREARSYLDALELKEDFKELITSYSLEISLSLKPLADGRGPAPVPEPEMPAPEPEPEPEEDDNDEYRPGD